jgi:hypothetical protein
LFKQKSGLQKLQTAKKASWCMRSDFFADTQTAYLNVFQSAIVCSRQHAQYQQIKNYQALPNAHPSVRDQCCSSLNGLSLYYSRPNRRHFVYFCQATVPFCRTIQILARIHQNRVNSTVVVWGLRQPRQK